MTIDLSLLPSLKKLFQLLTRGYHVSSGDFSLYNELQENEETYQRLFKSLGFDLQYDRRGFYYLGGGEGIASIKGTSRKIAHILFVLTEYFADKGGMPYQKIMHDEISVSRELTPAYEAHADALAENGFTSVETLINYLRGRMNKLGFSSVNGDTLRFNPPIARFLDLCITIAEQYDKAKEEKERLTAEETSEDTTHE